MTDDELDFLARMAGLAIDSAHAPGVIRNLAILLEQAELLGETPLSPLIEPAPVYRP